jgi:Ring finger domain
MSRNSNTLGMSTEQLYVINILNNMYNNNVRQINSMNASINSLFESNDNIRDMLVQIINNSHTGRRNQRSNRVQRESRENPNRRIYFNNVPYIIESVEGYRIPPPVTQDYLTENMRNLQLFNTNTTRTTTNDTNNSFANILRNFFQPIEIFPTQTQIEIATRRARYGDIVSPINRDCPITLDRFNDEDIVTVIRHCGHIFQSNALSRWFGGNCRCPVCRYDIRNYNPSRDTLTGSPRQDNIETGMEGAEREPEGVERNEEPQINLEQDPQEEQYYNNYQDDTALAIESLLNNVYQGFSVSDLIADLSGNSLMTELSNARAVLSFFNSIPRRRQ